MYAACRCCGTPATAPKLPALPPQVLCGTERLLALGRRCGLRLQIHATTDAAASAVVVGAVASAWLARWRGMEPGMQYSVVEAPTEEEAFLTRLDRGWDAL